MAMKDLRSAAVVQTIVGKRGATRTRHEITLFRTICYYSFSAVVAAAARCENPTSPVFRSGQVKVCAMWDWDEEVGGILGTTIVVVVHARRLFRL